MNNLEVEFVEFDRVFLGVSWKWLMDDEIRTLTNASFITKSKQEEWFASLPSQADYYIWGIKYLDIPIGVCGIKHKTLKNGEYWGYIGDKNYWGKGIGKVMLQFIEHKAKMMNLNALYLHVSSDNIRALKLYSHYGFLIESKDRNLIRMNKNLW